MRPWPEIPIEVVSPLPLPLVKLDGNVYETPLRRATFKGVGQTEGCFIVSINSQIADL